jgi:CBS domain-containing protein
MHSILVNDYMDNNPHAVPDSYSVRQVVLFLAKEKVSSAPVVDANKRLVGIVSEKDCLKEALNDAMYCEESPSVTQVMTKDVITSSPESSVLAVAEMMLDHAPREYPVVNNGVLVGMISRSTILKAILENNDDCYFNH